MEKPINSKTHGIIDYVKKMLAFHLDFFPLAVAHYLLTDYNNNN